LLVIIGSPTRRRSPVKKLTVVGNFDLMGEVSGQFVKAEMFTFLGPEK
jgi:hypothetical protein